jgi:hypothetical protein
MYPGCFPAGFTVNGVSTLPLRQADLAGTGKNLPTCLQILPPETKNRANPDGRRDSRVCW